MNGSERNVKKFSEDKIPLFSVLVPVYNTEMYLKKCFDSILSQDTKDIEIIAVDDGSTDNSGEICDEYAEQYPEIIKVIHKENGGPISARRTALRIARGRFITFCDADDYYYPGAFHKLRNIIENNEVDIILFLMDSELDGKIIDPIIKPDHNNDGFSEDKRKLYMGLLDGRLASLSIKCIKKSCIDIENDYSKYGRLHFGEDELQFVEIISRVKKCYWLNDSLYVYRKGSGITSKGKDEERYRSFRRVYSLYKEKSPEWGLDKVEKALSSYYFNHLSFFLDSFQKEIYDLRHRNLIREISEDPEFEISYDEAVSEGIIDELPRNRQILFKFMRMKLFFIIDIYYKYVEIRRKIQGRTKQVNVK